MKEAYYFSHDGNARNDEKLIAVRMKYKWEGYGLFWAIIEKLRETTNYKLSKDYNLIAYDLRTESSVIKSLIEDFGLFVFTDCGKYFYSERLLNSMEMREQKSKKASENAFKRWEKCERNANAMQTHSIGNAINENCNAIKERKGKESKEYSETPQAATRSKLENLEIRKTNFYEDLKPFLSSYNKEMLRKFYEYWSEFNKSKTKMRWELQDTFEISKRLSTWASRDKEFDENSNVNFKKPPKSIDL